MKNDYLNILQRFIQLNRQSLPMFFLALALIMAAQALNAGISIGIGKLIDAIAKAQIDSFFYIILVVFGLQLCKLATQYQVTFRVNALSEVCIRRMRSHTYSQITKARMRWLDESQLGDLITRLNGDLNAFVEAIHTFLTWEISSLVAFIVSISACFIMNWQLSLISFALLPLLGPLQFYLGVPIAKLATKRADAEGESNAAFIDLLGGLTVSKAFGIEQEVYKTYEATVDRAVDANVKSFTKEFVMYPLQMIMHLAPTVLIVAFGAMFVLNGQMTIGALISFIMLAMVALQTIGSLSWQVRDIYNTLGIAKRIYQIWDVETEPEGGSITVGLTDIPVKFKDLVFAYTPGHTVLDGLNFSAQRGEHIALVGASGCGKSTILKLLAGFYERDQGDIQIFGQAIDHWQRVALRQHISYVGQDSFLFPGSILDNVKLGNSAASQQDACRVIEAVGLGNLDLTAEIGERGVLLSGGQRQRICIARALLKNAEIVLLDEPTSALDTESEFMVNEALSKLAQGKTCIMIAHRLSTIHNVDRIICLDQGKIAQEGSHEELMARGGIYRNLYEKQVLEANHG